MTVREAGALVRATATSWSEDQGWIYAGAMAAFAGLALAPLVLITYRAGQAFGNERPMLAALAAIGGVVVGPAEARHAEEAIARSNAGSGGAFALVVATLIALTAGWRFILAMQTALKTFWDVETGPRAGAWKAARDVAVSALAAALVLAALLVALALAPFLFSHETGPLARAAGLTRAAVALGAVALLVPVFAALYVWLPRARVAWQDVWVAAAASAAFFAGGQFVIGAYLALRHVQSTFGSLSAIVVVLLWLYYSSYTFLLGAEFAQAYARRDGDARDQPLVEKPG